MVNLSPEEREERSKIDRIEKEQLGWTNILRLRGEIRKIGKEEERSAKQLAKLNAEEQANADAYLDIAKKIEFYEKKIADAKKSGSREEGAYMKTRKTQLAALKIQEEAILRTAGGSYKAQESQAALRKKALTTERNLLMDINKQRGLGLPKIGAYIGTTFTDPFKFKEVRQRQIEYARAAAGGGGNLGGGGAGGSGGAGGGGGAAGGAGAAGGSAGGGGGGGKKAVGIIAAIGGMGLIGAGIAAALTGLSKLSAAAKVLGGALKSGLTAPLSSAAGLISGGGFGIGGGAVSGAGATDILGGLAGIASQIPFIGGLLGGLINGFKSILDAVLGIDQANTNLARTLGISKEEAQGLNQQYRDIARSSDSIVVNQARLAESQIELTQQIGVRNNFDRSILENNIKLKELAGFEVESRKAIAESSIITGRSAEKITKNILSQVKGFELATGVAFDFKQTIGEAAKQSGVLGLQFANYPGKLTMALMKVKAMGFELKDLDANASSFLDFESSITKEFEAQVLTGKDMNLTKAREAALNNDLVGLAKEITKQVGTTSEFLSMDRIKQEAIASAVGMTRESLADVLKKQDMYRKLGADNLKQAQEELRVVKEKGMTQEEITAKLGKDTYEYITQTSTAERIVEIMNKIKASFIEFMEKSGLFDFLTDPDKVNSFLRKIINGIAGAVQMIGDLIAGILEFAGEWIPGVDKGKMYGRAASIRQGAATLSGGISATAGAIGGSPAASIGETVVAGQTATAAATTTAAGGGTASTSGGQYMTVNMVVDGEVVAKKVLMHATKVQQTR